MSIATSICLVTWEIIPVCDILHDLQKQIGQVFEALRCTVIAGLGDVARLSEHGTAKDERERREVCTSKHVLRLLCDNV